MAYQAPRQGYPVLPPFQNKIAGLIQAVFPPIRLTFPQSQERQKARDRSPAFKASL